MSTSIRITGETKRKLEAMKRSDETFDELLNRLARSEKDVEEMAGWGDDDIRDHVDEKREELNASLEERKELSE
jgi:predicted CopG family antitoxin